MHIHSILLSIASAVTDTEVITAVDVTYTYSYYNHSITDTSSLVLRSFLSETWFEYGLGVMTQQQDRGKVPRWNGRLETIDDFTEDVRIYATGAKKDERVLCGARLIGVMADGTAQKRQALAFNAIALGKDDGALELVQFLKEKLGNQARST